MVQGISSLKNVSDKKEHHKDYLEKDTSFNKIRLNCQNLRKASTTYAKKGLRGDKNSNFHEFLLMGTIPYIVGSLTLMAIFNSANKFFAPFNRSRASAYGKKMAMGVLLYGIGKSLGKAVINSSVKSITGIDMTMPYTKVIKELPNDDGKSKIAKENHKVFESVEFTRWDLLYNKENVLDRNEYFDKIAKKMNINSSLKDSDQEMKPIIRETVTKTRTATNIIPYLWAATGVAMATQNTWDDFFKTATLKFWNINSFVKTLKNFIKSSFKSINELYKGTSSNKWSGKLLILTTLASTVLGIGNALINSKKPSKQQDIIDKSKTYVVT